jgi:ABC-2 type transport system permease protein
VSALLRAELLKLRTTRTFIAFVAASVAIALLITLLFGLLATKFTEHDIKSVFALNFTSLFILLLGVMGMSGEWRHRTITGTVLAAPDRLRLLGAKLLSYAAAGALLALGVTLAMVAVGSIILSLRGETTLGAQAIIDVLWRNVAVGALLGALGVGIGGLLRNQVPAIVGILIFAFAVEPVLIAFAPGVARFAPIQSAPNAIVRYVLFGVLPDNPLAPGIAVLVLLGWIALFFAAAGARLKKFDLV